MGGRIGSVLPSSRGAQRDAERADKWFNDESVRPEEHGAGGSRELKQHCAEPCIETTNINARDHPYGLSLLEPHIDPISLGLAPRLELIDRR